MIREFFTRNIGLKVLATVLAILLWLLGRGIIR